MVRATKTVPQKIALNFHSLQIVAGFVNSLSKRTLINHNIHEAPATESE